MLSFYLSADGGLFRPIFALQTQHLLFLLVPPCPTSLAQISLSFPSSSSSYAVSRKKSGRPIVTAVLEVGDVRCGEGGRTDPPTMSQTRFTRSCVYSFTGETTA